MQHIWKNVVGRFICFIFSPPSSLVGETYPCLFWNSKFQKKNTHPEGAVVRFAIASSTDRARYRAARVLRLDLEPLGSRNAGEAEVRESVVSFLLLRPFGPEDREDFDKEGHRLLELGSPRLWVVRSPHFTETG